MVSQERDLAMASAVARELHKLVQSAPVVQPEYLPSKLAARYLGTNTKKLERLRGNGSGPSFRKFGREIRYKRTDLDDFMVQSYRSTAEVKSGKENGA